MSNILNATGTLVINQDKLKGSRRLDSIDRAVVLQVSNKQLPFMNLSLQITSGAGLLAILCVFRIANALLINTAFDPDEYYQSLEIAHHHAFGRGYVTWEWVLAIRSYTHPVMFILVYRVVQFLNGGRFWVLIAPKILQGCISAFADYYVFKLANLIFGITTAKWVLFSSLISWFNYYCMARTYSNSTETTLTTIAMYYWMNSIVLPTKKAHFRIALVLAAIACVIRPTSAIVWIFMGVYKIIVSLQASDRLNRTTGIISDVLIIGYIEPKLRTIIIITSVSIDSHFFGRFVFTPWNFYKLNIIQNISLYYGGHPIWFYFVGGWPLILTLQLGLVAYGISVTRFRLLFYLVLLFTCIMSLVTHKELRFMLPMLPFTLIYSGVGITNLPPKLRKYILAWITLTNICVAIYFTRIHKSGVINATHWISNPNNMDLKPSLAILMPCHSSPMFSHIHLDLPIRMVSCLPPVLYLLSNLV